MAERKYPTTSRRENLSEYYVNKSNALVQASYRLSLNEHRILLCAVAKLDSKRISISPRADQISRVRIYATEFAQTFGVPTNIAYKSIKEGAAKLYERTVQTFDGRVKERFRWITKEAYADGEGYVEISFTPDAAIYLTLLKHHFTSYQLKHVSHLNSMYSIRLFEQLAQYRESGVFRISLADFITRLEIPYDRWIHVKQRVIDPAVAEIRANSNLSLEYEATKTGRQISSLVFRFSPSPQSQLEFEQDAPDLTDDPE